VTGAVRLVGVRKVFRRASRVGRLHTFKGALFHRQLGRGLASAEEFVALDGVDLEVGAGEAVAVIGPNGSGKSTLLKLISGILQPSAGSVAVEGRVTALIELGAGFHPEISGRENVIINGMLLGLSRQEIGSRMEEILDFAGIGDFVDQPVKTYSSGMYLRLGFAVAVAVQPDVLLIDEILAVGDAAFSRKGLDRLARMQRQGVAMVLVSHDLDLVRAFASRALYLRGGRVVAAGPTDVVVARYRTDVAGADEPDECPRPAVRVVEEGRRWGNGEVEILAVEVASGGVSRRVVPSGAECTVTIRYRVLRAVEDFVFGIAWHTADGTLVGGHNTALDGIRPFRLGRDGEVRCAYPSLQLAPGDYLLDAAVHAADGLAYDYWCQATSVRVTAGAAYPGVWAPTHRWEAAGPEWLAPAPSDAPGHPFGSR
jgi:lipopolysaccharide transport system ATP-binding protein